MFNLQSGMHRRRFPPRLTPAQARKLKILQGNKSEAPAEHEGNPKAPIRGGSKHTKAVTGIMVDGLNRTTISCGLDGKIKVCPWYNLGKICQKLI